MIPLTREDVSANCHLIQDKAFHVALLSAYEQAFRFQQPYSKHCLELVPIQKNKKPPGQPEALAIYLPAQRLHSARGLRFYMSQTMPQPLLEQMHIRQNQQQHSASIEKEFCAPAIRQLQFQQHF